MHDLINTLLTPKRFDELVSAVWILFAAGTLSAAIALTYRVCRRGVSYSASFAHTLVLISVVIAIALHLIGDSTARAFGLLGAVSLIRYRTAVKDPKDTAFMLFALGVGMAVGTGFPLAGAVLTAFGCLLMYVLSRLQFGKVGSLPLVVTIDCDRNNARAPKTVDDLLSRETEGRKLLLTEGAADASTVTLTYETTLGRKCSPDELVLALQRLTGIQRVLVFNESHGMNV
jgi:hypothetical protein